MTSKLIEDADKSVSANTLELLVADDQLNVQPVPSPTG